MQTFFGKRIADLHRRALRQIGHFVRGQNRATADAVAPGRVAKIHHGIARAFGIAGG